MGIFDKPKKTAIESRRYQEKLYEVALEEFENGEIRKGLYAKALSMGDGNKEKADGIYLKLRVKSIMDDIESEQINRREDARAYEALQELRDIEHRKGLVDSESIKTKNWTNSLHYQCIELLGNKGYELHKSKSGEYHVGAKDNPIYSSKDLNDIKKWAHKAKRSL